MLETLPFEIVINITHCLDFYDKFELSKTCRRFCQMIPERCLYEDLKLDNEYSIRRNIRRFKTQTLNGDQVKTLSLDLSVLSNQLYRRLPVIFPNCTEIINSKGSKAMRDVFALEPWEQ
jgi:hypothetical protein